MATNTGQMLPERRRVLLVEDHELLAEATAELLRRRGLDVYVVLAGHDALTAAATFQPDIVLCDLSLPDITGVDIVKALRNHPGTSSALFVLHTAYRTTDFGDVSGVDVVVSKPLTAGTLEGLLELLSRRRTQSENPGT